MRAEGNNIALSGPGGSGGGEDATASDRVGLVVEEEQRCLKGQNLRVFFPFAFVNLGEGAPQLR